MKRRKENKLQSIWFKLLFAEMILLGIIGTWAIMGKNVEIYQSNDPNVIKNITFSTGTYRFDITYINDCENNIEYMV